MKVLLQELQAEGVEGIVIDLRDNGGGSLQEANESVSYTHLTLPPSDLV